LCLLYHTNSNNLSLLYHEVLVFYQSTCSIHEFYQFCSGYHNYASQVQAR
jgi:hypothetical protein